MRIGNGTLISLRAGSEEPGKLYNRIMLLRILRLALTIPLLMTLPATAESPQVTVFKLRTCSCCAKWIEHLRANGFEVTVQEVDSTADYEAKYGVPASLRSCHTAIVDGYTIEGHVPAQDIQRLLKERPAAKGLAVPGMPIGSPGMEVGTRVQAYSVMLFDAEGNTSTYQSYPSR